jgi:hypothetical protein
MSPRIIPDEIEQRVAAWKRYIDRWWLVHYILGITGTVSSIIVASRPAFMSRINYLVEGFALLAAACFVTITFLMPARRARAYVSAWRLLAHACTSYKVDQSYTLERLLNALAEREKIIENSDPA